MTFDYQPEKSASNRLKHGIDFEEAQGLWDDPAGLVVKARAMRSEERFARVAVLNSKVWFAVYTLRGETTRIITVRRARKYEQEQYYNRND